MQYDDTYTGFYIGPFRQKKIHENGNGSHVSETIRRIDFDKIFEVIKEFVELWGKQRNLQISFTKAESTIHSALIDDNVKCHIEKADFVIADISGDNRNALLELGYAEGKNLPYIIISQGSIDIQLPSDKHGRIIAPYDPDEEKLTSLKNNLRIQMEFVIDQVKQRRTAENYLVECFCKRDVNMIDREIDRCDDCIHILQTNLETINANHLNHIKARMKKSPKLRLRILTLDPQSTFVNERARQLGRSGDGIGVYRDGLVTSLDQARLELEPFKKSVRIRVYDDFPTQMTYRFDNRLLVCTVSRITKSRENVSFLINNLRKSGVFQSFVDHFREVWQSPTSRTVFGDLDDDEFLEVADHKIHNDHGIVSSPKQFAPIVSIAPQIQEFSNS